MFFWKKIENNQENILIDAEAKIVVYGVFEPDHYRTNCVIPVCTVDLRN